MAPIKKKIDIKKEWITEAVIWACNRINFTIDRNYMNDRQISEKLDDTIMGEIGSIVILKYLNESGIEAIAYDQVRNDEFRNHDPGWDIVVGSNLDQWFAEQIDPQSYPEDAKTLSIKTSRIPITYNTKGKDEDTQVQVCIQDFDFKIFKKNKTIESDISTDFEVQIYYPINSSYSMGLVVDMIEVENGDTNSIIQKLKISERYAYCYIASVGGKANLIGYSNSRPESKRTWNSIHAGVSKMMWRAPLWLGISIDSFVDKFKI